MSKTNSTQARGSGAAGQRKRQPKDDEGSEFGDTLGEAMAKNQQQQQEQQQQQQPKKQQQQQQQQQQQPRQQQQPQPAGNAGKRAAGGAAAAGKTGAGGEGKGGDAPGPGATDKSKTAAKAGVAAADKEKEDDGFDDPDDEEEEEYDDASDDADVLLDEGRQPGERSQRDGNAGNPIKPTNDAEDDGHAKGATAFKLDRERVTQAREWVRQYIGEASDDIFIIRYSGPTVIIAVSGIEHVVDVSLGRLLYELGTEGQSTILPTGKAAELLETVVENCKRKLGDGTTGQTRWESLLEVAKDHMRKVRESRGSKKKVGDLFLELEDYRVESSRLRTGRLPLYHCLIRLFAFSSVIAEAVSSCQNDADRSKLICRRYPIVLALLLHLQKSELITLRVSASVENVLPSTLADALAVCLRGLILVHEDEMREYIEFAENLDPAKNRNPTRLATAAGGDQRACLGCGSKSHLLRECPRVDDEKRMRIIQKHRDNKAAEGQKSKK
jgi:hypothetical protein